VAVYVDGRLAARDHLSSPDVPKALRIAITYQDDLYRRFALDWRPELVPQLEPPEATHLRGSFTPLRQGDWRFSTIGLVSVRCPKKSNARCWEPDQQRLNPFNQ
jgi:hypothetical protein